jgi:hypothetical protein
MREWLEDPEAPWWAKLRRAQVHISEVRQRAWNTAMHGDEACATNSMSRAERADRGRRDRHLDRQDAHSCRIERVVHPHAYALSGIFTRNVERATSRDDQRFGIVIRVHDAPSA